MIDSIGGIKLIPIVDLGDTALFLGNYGSTSISASQQFPYCKPNFIYDYLHDYQHMTEFNFKDGSFEEKYVDCREWFLSWYMPSMIL